MSRVYIGIGSNLGDRQKNCLDAIRLLEARGIRVTKRSMFRETEPWGKNDQPKFINLAVEAHTVLKPRELLETLLSIEAELGRVREERWGPRIIDLDILLYDDLVISEPGLMIPHPRLHERDFVLGPLAEIAPDVVHPVSGRTVRLLQIENSTRL